MSNASIDIQKIIKETRETLLNPKEYFSSMRLSGGFMEPLIKAALYGVVAGIFSLIWSLLNLTPMAGDGMWEGAFGVMELIWSVIAAIIGAFIGGAVMLVISAICGGNTDYEANVRVATSVMAVYPISSFLAFLYGINSSLGDLSGVAMSLWSVYLVYLGSIMALKGKENRVKVVAVVLLILSLLGFWGGSKASRTVEDFNKNFEFEQLD
jgi:hypothetical protein